MRSDFELVSACKSGNKQAYEELFTRYIPFLSKKYYSACKMYSGFSNVYEFSDFLSEGYISLTRAVNYTELHKITDPDHWKFLGVYMWFVSTMRTKLSKSIVRRNKNEAPILTSAELDGESETQVEFEAQTISPEQAVCEESIIQSFYQTLTPYEREIVAERCVTDQQNNPTPIMKIAKRRQEPFSRIQQACKRIEHKFASVQ